MTKSPQCLPRSSDPLDQELAARLNAWGDDASVDSQQSLRPVLIELACWVGAAVLVAGIAIVWLV